MAQSYKTKEKWSNNTFVKKLIIVLITIIFAFFTWLVLFNILDLLDYVYQPNCIGDWIGGMGALGFPISYLVIAWPLYIIFNNIFLKQRSLKVRIYTLAFCFVIMLAFIYIWHGGNLSTLFHLRLITWCTHFGI